MVGLDAWNGGGVPFRRKDDGKRDGLEITHSVKDEIQSFSPGTPFSDVVAKWASNVGIEYTEEQKKQARQLAFRADAAGDAYGGLVPRKASEWHHHFDLTSEAGLTKCVTCGGDPGAPCLGPDWQAWDARMSQRRSLKERLFHLAYGISEVGHEEAARQMAEFNAETLRLFPERFREPTVAEQEARARFMELVSAPLTPTFQQTAAEALRVIRQQERLSEQIRAAKEAAWDEGREAESDAHFADGGYGNVQHPKNPYRKDDRD